jgi:ADP-ribosylglycohydrolase
MPGYTNFENLINLEKAQLIEEGVTSDAAEKAVAEAQQRRLAGAHEADVWSVFADLPRRGDFAFVEPSDLRSIKADRSGDSPKLSFDPTDDVLLDKMHGAWLGRCAGCALGKPVESFMSEHNGLRSWERQKEYLIAISPDEWPLKDYYPKSSPAEQRTGKIWGHNSLREHIAFMESDDDIRYTVLGQVILQKYGRHFASSHVAGTWFDLLGYRQVCTAETQAYRNMVIAADQFRGAPSVERAHQIDAETDWHFIVNHLNPYREWIGAQIRVDSYGYAAAGNPELAAELAWHDARISHVKNGIYGAMLCAAMIAASFATNDPMTIVRAGLAQIPRRSRLHADVLATIKICEKHGHEFANFEAVIRDIYALLGHYHAAHTNNNAALCVAALLLSRGDFHKAITLAVMGGWDTDCNGATVGSMVGAVSGAKKTPGHWTMRLNDTLNSYVVGYHPIAISECAKRAGEIWKRVRSEA